MEKEKLREVASPTFRPSNQVSCSVQAHALHAYIDQLQSLPRTFSDAVS